MVLVRITPPKCPGSENALRDCSLASSRQLQAPVSADSRAAPHHVAPTAPPQFYVNPTALAAQRTSLSAPPSAPVPVAAPVAPEKLIKTVTPVAPRAGRSPRQKKFAQPYRAALRKSRVKYPRLQPVIACSIMVFSLFFASAQPFGKIPSPFSAAAIHALPARPQQAELAFVEPEAVEFPDELTKTLAEEATLSTEEVTPSAATVFESASGSVAPIVTASEDLRPVEKAKPSVPLNVSDSLHRRMSQIRFLSGMIAIHMPSITDCGALAKDIVELSAEKKIDPFYVASVISVESRFGSEARSHAGAVGLMQLLPSTARDVYQDATGKRGNPLLTHPRTNIRLGIDYLQDLETRYSGNKYRALAAYNWGPANVDRTVELRRKVPAAVNKYALTILERAVNWRKHFEKAEVSASSIASGDVNVDGPGQG